MIKKISTKVMLAAVVAIALAGLTTAVVMASIPDANGQITACLKNTNGTTRIIDTATENCSANESSLAWSQGGPKVFSKTEVVPLNTATQDVIVVPNFATFRSLECDDNGVFRFDIYNHTTHAVTTGYPSNSGVVEPGGLLMFEQVNTSFEGNIRSVPGLLLTYAEGGESFTAHVTYSPSTAVTAGFPSGCRYQVQATISKDS